MSESLQKQHYDRILDDYAAHYDDPCSARYRDRFFCDPLLEDLALRGRRVLEAMCGSGQTTERLALAGARVIGLDLSSLAVRRFRTRRPDVGVVCASLLRVPLASGSIDAAIVVGGLHHLHPHLDEAIDEVHRILRPGGVFGFVEPHRDALVDRIRRLWYRHDRWFEANEASIDVAALKRRNAGRFDFELERYGGNLAYFLVLNSLILRVPLGWKRFYTPALLWLEERIGRLQGPATSSFVIARWRKR